MKKPQHNLSLIEGAIALGIVISSTVLGALGQLAPEGIVATYAAVLTYGAGKVNGYRSGRNDNSSPPAQDE